MPKFENIDILETLKEIMKTNIKFYQDDFELDKEMLLMVAEGANKLSPPDKAYLWMFRMFIPHGTVCLKERNIL